MQLFRNTAVSSFAYQLAMPVFGRSNNPEPCLQVAVYYINTEKDGKGAIHGYSEKPPAQTPSTPTERSRLQRQLQQLLQLILPALVLVIAFVQDLEAE